MCIMIWDDRSSINLPVLTGGSGLMITHDEETRRYFAGSKVGTAAADCNLLCISAELVSPAADRRCHCQWLEVPDVLSVHKSRLRHGPSASAAAANCRPLLFMHAAHSQLWDAHTGGGLCLACP